MFRGCKNLREVRVLAEADGILNRAFCECNALGKLYLAGAADCLRDDFPQGADCVIIAPKVKLSSVPPSIKAMLVSGFAAADEAGEAEKGWAREEYLRYIRSQRKRLFPLALRRQELLRLMLAQKMLLADDIKVLLQNEKCDAEAKAVLLRIKAQISPTVIRMSFLRRCAPWSVLFQGERRSKTLKRSGCSESGRMERW